MPTLTEQLRAAGLRPATAKKAVEPPQPLQPDAPVEMYHPGLDESPLSAGASELGRTAKEAAIGVARSPLDLLKGLLGLPGQVVSGLFGKEGLPALIKDPSLLGETGAAVKSGVTALGDNPRDAGSMLGQLLIGKLAGPTVAGAVGEAAAPVYEGVTRNVGKGVSAVGRGAEAVGKATKHPVVTTATGGAPYAAEFLGKGAQKLGDSLQGLAERSLDARSPQTVNRPGLRAPSREVSGSSYSEPVETGSRTSPNISGYEPPAKTPGELSMEDALGKDRTTGSFEEGPGGLSSLADQSPLKNASIEAISNDLEGAYNTRRTPALPSAEDFAYEGTTSGRPGELTAPRQTIGEIQGPMEMGDVPVSRSKMPASIDAILGDESPAGHPAFENSEAATSDWMDQLSTHDNPAPDAKAAAHAKFLEQLLGSIQR